MLNLDALLLKAIPVVRRAGQIIAESWNNSHAVIHKGVTDLVTETDKAVEDFLKRELAELLPEAAFIGEESASAADAQGESLCWIVDPVDGTTNFVHRIPAVAVSVALCEKNLPLFGIVDAPILGECFYAARDSRAFCNGEPVGVSGATRLIDSVVGTGFPYDAGEHLPEILNRIGKILPATQGLRRFGSAAIDLCWVACGRLDAFYEADLKPWDMAAGWLIVMEAGGEVSDFFGKEPGFGKPVLASNGKIHEELLSLLA